LNAGRPRGTIAAEVAITDHFLMLEKIETRLEEARAGERPIELPELESLYTSGCAEILELEADGIRIKRRLQDLRDQLRHIRTAIEFLQEEQAAGGPAQ
jgi:hypothetical protein